jgi:hypothetical protein
MGLYALLPSDHLRGPAGPYCVFRLFADPLGPSRQQKRFAPISSQKRDPNRESWSYWVFWVPFGLLIDLAGCSNYSVSSVLASVLERSTR